MARTFSVHGSLRGEDSLERLMVDNARQFRMTGDDSVEDHRTPHDG
jgi:hypothetical protein